MEKIPYNQLKTLFLDVGGTILTIDFDWVCTELNNLGIACEVNDLQRAEAAARPVISTRLQELQQRRGLEIFEFFLNIVFDQLPAEIITDESQSARIAHELLPILYPGGISSRLWSYVLPGVREALEKFKAMGLQLVVVSNADGTVEQSLESLQLRSYFDVVVDSHVVQVEKPDPKIFQIALESSGAIPEYTLHVGDIYNIDVVGAWSAGIHGLLLDPYSDWQDVDCERIPDLLALCDKIVNTTV
jgi:HAD superfamily hydrolase (TIGR01509 family)